MNTRKAEWTYRNSPSKLGVPRSNRGGVATKSPYNLSTFTQNTTKSSVAKDVLILLFIAKLGPRIRGKFVGSKSPFRALFVLTLGVLPGWSYPGRDAAYSVSGTYSHPTISVCARKPELLLRGVR